MNQTALKNLNIPDKKQWFKTWIKIANELSIKFFVLKKYLCLFKTRTGVAISFYFIEYK